ncbi:MAG: hypothetical protein U1F81_04450 [Verrucomicrobiaceae bacterium]
MMKTSIIDMISFIAVCGLICGLVILRVFVFLWKAQNRGYSFRVLNSLHKLLQVLASFTLPGLGQAVQGRFEIAAFHILLIGTAWYLAGWYAIPVHVFSALECAWSERAESKDVFAKKHAQKRH